MKVCSTLKRKQNPHRLIIKKRNRISIHFLDSFMLFFCLLLCTIAILTYVYSRYQEYPVAEFALVALIIYLILFVCVRKSKILLKKYQISFLILVPVMVFQILWGIRMGFAAQEAIFMLLELLLMISIPTLLYPKAVFTLTMLVTFFASNLFLYEIYTRHLPLFRRLNYVPDFNIQGIGTWGFLFCACVLLMDDVLRMKYKGRLSMRVLLVRIYLFAIAVLLTAAMFLFHRDASKVCASAVVAAHFIPEMKLLKSKLVAVFITLAPCLVSFGSIFLYVLGVRDSSNLSLLNNREWIWMDWLSKVFEHPFAGNGWKVNAVYTHNSFVDFLYMWGCPFVIAFLYGFYHLLRYTQNNVASRLRYDAFVAFTLCIVHSCTESMFFFTGVGVIFVYMFHFMIIANYGPVSESEELREADCLKRRRNCGNI